MKRIPDARRARRQRGVAAVEMALMLSLMILMLAAPLFLGRVFYHYEVAQRAVHDAAVYLSTVPQIEMKTSAQAANEAALAAAIVAEEIAGLAPGPLAPVVAVQCDGSPCAGFSVPSTIRVVVLLDMFDEAFGPYTGFLTGDNGLALTADVTMRYVGK